MGVPAFLGSAGGAVLASKIPTSSMRPMVLVLLIVVAIYTLVSNQILGKYENLPPLSEAKSSDRRFSGSDWFLRWNLWSWNWLFSDVDSGCFAWLRIYYSPSAIAKVVNVATNVGAIMVFGFNGAVIWQVGIIMGVANISGAILGSRLAIKGGSTLVRKVFLIVTLALIIKVGIDTF